MSTSAQVLYGLIQGQNPALLSIPFDHVSFSNPVFNSAEDYASLGKNSSTMLSAQSYSDQVQIYYDRVNVANALPDPNVQGVWTTYLRAPQGVYTTTQDFVPMLNSAGIPVVAADIVSTPIQNFWSNPNDFDYAYQAFALVQWNNSLGYTGFAWVAYGPSTSANLATAFSKSYYDLNQNNTAFTGDPATILVQYNNAYLSGQQQDFGASFTNQQCVYSNLATPDGATSAANGNCNTSCTVTFTPNANYPDAPKYPYYTGGQTVYYNRFNPATDAAAILGYQNAFYVADSAAPNIPLGSLLGTTVVTSVDLLNFIVNNSTGDLYFTAADIVHENLPTAYGEDGTVSYSFKFQNSYFVLDGEMPVTLNNALPDMSVIAQNTDFGGQFLATFLYDASDNYAFMPNGTVADAALYLWITSHWQDDEVKNWLRGLSIAIVPGSIHGVTDPVTTTADLQCTVTVTTPWGTTFQTNLYFTPQPLIANTNYQSFVVNGTLTGAVEPSLCVQPLRVIDWLLSPYFYHHDPSGSMSGNLYPQYFLSQFFAYGEFTNLHDLVLPDANGNLTFTLTANPASTIQSGSLTISISPDSGAPAGFEVITPPDVQQVA